MEQRIIGDSYRLSISSASQETRIVGCCGTAHLGDFPGGFIMTHEPYILATLDYSQFPEYMCTFMLFASF